MTIQQAKRLTALLHVRWGAPRKGDLVLFCEIARFEAWRLPARLRFFGLSVHQEKRPRSVCFNCASEVGPIAECLHQRKRRP
jgi:hypothetical protein